MGELFAAAVLMAYGGMLYKVASERLGWSSPAHGSSVRPAPTNKEDDTVIPADAELADRLRHSSRPEDIIDAES